MKIFQPFEKIFTIPFLLALNIAGILATELVGGGTFFAKTGLVHSIAVLFVGLIIIRILTDYAFSDHILRGFLKIQLAFFLLLGFVHVYEYLGLIVFTSNDAVVELTGMASYLLCLIGGYLAFEFVFRIYYKKSATVMVLASALLAIVFIGILLVNISPYAAGLIPNLLPEILLVGVVFFGGATIFSIRKVREIMPVFKEYSLYATPAVVLLVLAAFSEYSESAHLLNTFGISDVQNLYISHFLIYAVLSLLLIAFGKLKKPKGIYVEEV